MVLQMLMDWLHHLRLLIALPSGTGCTTISGTDREEPQALQTCAARGLLRFVQLGCRQLISCCLAIASAHLTRR